MALNVKKTKTMILYSRRKFPDASPLVIKLNEKIIEEVKTVKLLGITFDQHLKWDHQITNIYNIVNSRLYLLKRIRNNLTHRCRIQFYYALIHPHFLYCCTLWGNASNELLNDLLKLQKRAARLILDKKPDAPSIELFRQLRWIPIHNLIKMRKILLVFNTLKTSWPQDLCKLFSFLRDSHDVNTRSSITDLKLPRVKTEMAKSKLSYCGAMLFDSLPDELKGIDDHSLSSFKSKLKEFFINLNFAVDHVNKFSCNSCKHVVKCRCYLS